jgi:hypothetical protein
LRPKEEIVGRLLALKALWLWVDVHPQAEPEATVAEMLHANRLRDHLTPSELAILNLSRAEAFMDHGDSMGWRNENCWPLAWALGFQDEPSVLIGQVSGNLGRRLMLEWLPNNQTEAAAWHHTVELRGAQAVHDLEDLFYCAHNAVRSAQIGGSTVPPDFDPLADGGCIHERRHSLTWMISPQISWDDTDLST